MKFDTSWGEEVEKSLARMAAVKGDDFVHDDEALRLTVEAIKKSRQSVDRQLVN